MQIWRQLIRLPSLFALLLLFTPLPAQAAVEISFYSRELGANNFPHAFVTLKGQLDADGTAVDQSYGFTAKALTPAILMGSVGGKVIHEHASYIRQSEKQFSLSLSDDQYRAVLQTVEAWRGKAQPSYNLNRSNCVHFVGELARSAGLSVAFPKELMKKPRAFLVSIREANRLRVADH